MATIEGRGGARGRKPSLTPNIKVANIYCSAAKGMISAHPSQALEQNYVVVQAYPLAALWTATSIYSSYIFYLNWGHCPSSASAEYPR